MSYKYSIKYCDFLGERVATAEITIDTAETQYASFELALDYAKRLLKPQRYIEAIELERIIL